MCRPLIAAALFVMALGCGGQQPLSPTTTTTIPAGGTATLKQATGALCSLGASTGDLSRCAGMGITQTVATFTFRVPQDGTLQLSAITRYIAFEEYFLQKLTCNGVPVQVTGVSGKIVAEPDAFIPILGAGAGAVRNESVAAVSKNASCELALSFQLGYNPPFSPYDLTVVLQAQ